MVAVANSPLHRYRLPLLAVATMAAVVLVYWPTFARMMDMWSLITYQHGWLVYPVSLYVLWRKREALAAVPWRASWLGVVATALLVLLWIVAAAAGVQVIEFVAATLIIVALFWSIAGDAALSRMLFPLLLLLAAVPTGEFLVEPLMRATAEISAALLLLAGVPVFRDGQFFTLPGGSFEVADVCSGLRYLLAGVMASAAYAYVTYTSNRKRALFVAIAAVMLVVANGVRAFIVMYVASATDMRIFGGPDHVWFGMGLFAVVFLAIVWIGEGYADAPFAEEGRSTTRPRIDRRAASAVATAAALVLIVGGPLFQHAKALQTELPVAQPSPPALDGCTGPGEWLDGDYPSFQGADFVLRQAYTCAGRPVSVYVAGYRHQEQGKELISSANRVWPNDWRRFTEEGAFTLTANGASLDVREVRIDNLSRPSLVWHWYQVGETVTGSALFVKALEAVHALALEPVESSVVIVAIAGERGTGFEALRSALQPQAHAVLTWNRDRVREAP
ncbi:MAG: exosortase A [Woeseia sp.]